MEIPELTSLVTPEGKEEIIKGKNQGLIIDLSNREIVTPNMWKKKDSIEGVVLNQQHCTIAVWKIVKENTALRLPFTTISANTII